MRLLLLASLAIARILKRIWRSGFGIAAKFIVLRSAAGEISIPGSVNAAEIWYGLKRRELREVVIQIDAGADRIDRLEIVMPA